MKNKNVNPKLFYKRGNQMNFRFIKTPSDLYYHPAYRNLSLGAKSLYVVLSDRLGLSLQNQLADEEDDVFVLFKSKPAQDDTRNTQEKPVEDLSLSELLNVSPKSIKKYKEELIRYELLVEKRTGLGKVNRLYVLKPKENPLISRKLLQRNKKRDTFRKSFPALNGGEISQVNISSLYKMSSKA